MAGIGGVVVQFRADASKAIRETNKLVHSLKDVDKNASTAGKGIDGFGKVAKFGMAAAGAGVAAVGVGIAGLGTKMVMLAANFEESQNVLQSALGATADEMSNLSKLAKDLGASTIFSAQEASDAMIELAKAGLSTAEILDGAVAAAMDLAATEGMGLAEASTILAQTMAQFGIPAKRAKKIVDILAAGATASTTSVAGLSAGLKYVGASAKGLRIPLKDTVTALAALNNKGLDATTAGTALNRMLLGIAAPTGKAEHAMERYKLSFVDAAGEMKPLTDVIGILDERLRKLSSTERADVLKDIFQVEGGRAANLLMQTGVKNFDELATAVDKTGVAQQMAEARTKGLKGALEKLGGAAETIGIKIGEELLPVITDWVEDFTTWLDSPSGTKFFDDLATQVEDAAKVMADFGKWMTTDFPKFFEQLSEDLTGPTSLYARLMQIQDVLANITNGAYKLTHGGKSYEEVEAESKAERAREQRRNAANPATDWLLPKNTGSRPTGKGIRGGSGDVYVTVTSPTPLSAADSAALALRVAAAKRRAEGLY